MMIVSTGYDAYHFVSELTLQETPQDICMKMFLGFYSILQNISLFHFRRYCKTASEVVSVSVHLFTIVESYTGVDR